MTERNETRGELVGRTLGTRYDVLELIGAGGMGAVYRALDRELGEVVALKVILAELADDQDIVEQFRTEVRLARRVTHKNVARTFELGRLAGVLFATMELVEGESLAKLLRRRGRLPVGEAVAIACALCDALAAAHEVGIIHRDVKPDNVLVDETGRVVLTDFGVASVLVDRRGSSGTPPYMAPEQSRGEASSPAADIYAVGVVLHELLAGKPAFSGTLLEIYEAKMTTRVTTPGVPLALDEAIARATARDANERFASAGELRRALAPFAGERISVEVGDAGRHAGLTRTVSVRPPRGDSGKLYVAQAIHGDLLQRLARAPRIQVLASGDADLVVELAATDRLKIALIRGGARLAIDLPLAVAHVAVATETAAAAVIAALEPPPASIAADDRLLQARAIARNHFARWAAASQLLDEAAVLAPDDARIAASRALATVQQAFFAASTDHATLDRAADLVRGALFAAPELYETQLAAGQLELHRGDPARAAAHFRVAIACAPYEPSAHDQLGRMLTEAGCLDEGFARLRDAIALAPQHVSARWEIARSHALDQDWQEADRLVAELAAEGQDTLFGELRFVLWRQDVEHAGRLRERFAASPGFEPELFEALFAVICDGAWAAQRTRLLELARAPDRTSQRRRAIVAQLVAEAAALAGDLGVADAMIDHAVSQGLFDLHWLDRCPALSGLRTRIAFAASRRVVEARAHAIRDALYGDHSVETRRDATRVR